MIVVHAKLVPEKIKLANKTQPFTGESASWCHSKENKDKIPVQE